MSVLIDTNVVSGFARRRPDANVIRWAAAVPAFAISAITAQEIAYGLAWRPHPRVTAWFAAFLETCEALPITQEIALRAGELRGRLQARELVRTPSDMLIAATAQVHALTLVTRNTRDFEECLIPLLNPFA